MINSVPSCSFRDNNNIYSNTLSNDYVSFVIIRLKLKWRLICGPKIRTMSKQTVSLTIKTVSTADVSRYYCQEVIYYLTYPVRTQLLFVKSRLCNLSPLEQLTLNPRTIG